MKVSEICQDQTDRRRRIREVARHAESNEPNGIDYVEVEEGQLIITVYFLNKAPHDIQAANVKISGGVRIRDIKVKSITLCEMEDPERDDCMRVEVDKFGDFSLYTLKLVNAPAGRAGETPLTGFDPRYAQIDFSFKANCPSDLDCLPPNVCYQEPAPEPEIDYLAKDYSSFRQLILDRFTLIMPEWKETHVPDFGIAMVELLAYVGDYLSYYQDAVATEAYLATARERISVRRHALLVDYQVHEGCNARAWLCVKTDADASLRPEDVYFITGHNTSYGSGERMLRPLDLQRVPSLDYEVFEPLLPSRQTEAIPLYVAHNEIKFYTWHDKECCLPRGATSATLLDSWIEPPPPPPKPGKYDRHGNYEGGPKKQVRRGLEYQGESPDYEQEQEQSKYSYSPKEPPRPVRKRALHLKPGDVLIFEEILGPETGDQDDADKSHRHAVCLTKVELGVDPLYDEPVVYIEWAREDALPFTLCISTIGPAPECLPLKDVSVARGNVILIDHGATQAPEKFDVPEAIELPAGCITAYEPRETILKPKVFPAILKYGPVTQRTAYPTPAGVARTQLKFLSDFMSNVRAHLEQMWLQITEGTPLSKEAIADLEIVFGRQTLVRLGLVPASSKNKRITDPSQQADALGKLLGRFEELLSKKDRRLRVLRERVLSGYVLTTAEETEIREMFGERLPGDLGFLTRQILGPASAALKQQPRSALPCIDVLQAHFDPLSPDDYRLQWWPRHNLLASDRQDRHFVAEIDNGGRAHLRFGNGELGRSPEPGSRLEVTYRVGNGARGNVGAETISHIVFRSGGSIGANVTVRNPLPAQGGLEPEPIDEVRMFAPGAFRKELQRAITADDYARLAERDQLNRVQRAAGNLRWAGSWYEMRTAIDALGVEVAESQLLEDIKNSLYRFRRIGHDLAVEAARYVPLNIALHVCVQPHYLRGHVKAALTDVFSNRILPNGKRGFFHPDNLSFGQGITLSALVAAAQAVEGVESVRVTRLERLFEGDKGELESGLLPLGPLEVVRLDNDPSFPEHGLFTLDVGGGR